jgi:sugar (pentulose or hexulose) kinase
VGVFASVEEGYSRFSLRERVLEPNAARTAVYRPLFEKYKKMATALGEAYESLDAEKRSNQ